MEIRRKAALFFGGVAEILDAKGAVDARAFSEALGDELQARQLTRALP